jgi:hypothetical protein
MRVGELAAALATGNATAPVRTMRVRRRFIIDITYKTVADKRMRWPIPRPKK